MRTEYDIEKDEIICGEITSELESDADGHCWSFEYVSNDCYKHIKAKLDKDARLIFMHYEMEVSGHSVATTVEKIVGGNVYRIDGKEAILQRPLAVFEMLFLPCSFAVFDNAVLYNPPADDFSAINIKGSGNKLTVLYPGLCNVVIKDDMVLLCEMPRDELKICVRN